VSNIKNGKKKKGPRAIEAIVIDNNFLEIAPKLFEPDLYKQIRERMDIERFCFNFCRWNKHVPWLVYANSQPHKDLMTKLVGLMRDKVGESCADFGCGFGEFLTNLLETGECTIKKYFAIDLDWKTLVAIPEKLRNIYLGRKVYFVHTAAMFKSPLWDASMDSVISSLGALMYIWAWFDEDGNQVADSRQAFMEGLKDIYRILKPGGYLGVSAPLPNPDWKKIRNKSLRHILFNEFSFKMDWLKKIWETIYHGTKAVKYSRFMSNLEKQGKAHYLSKDEWTSCLIEVGFEVESIETGCFADQGIIVIARKI